MEGVHRRMVAARRICDRVTESMDRVLSDEYAMRIAVCCALRNSSAFLDFATNREVRERALPCMEQLKITPDEFAIIFGYGSVMCETGEADLLLSQNSSVCKLIQLVEEAMSYALREDDIAARNWKRQSCRLAAIVAIEMEDSSNALRAVIGPFGESDNRRLDDAREQIEELEISTEAVGVALEVLLKMAVLL